jgi:hypothetical protein
MPFSQRPPQGLPPEGMPQPYHPPEPPQLMDYPGELTNPNPIPELQYPEYYVPGGELPPPPTTRPGSGIYPGPSDLEPANPAGYADPPNPFPTPPTPLPSGGPLSPMELGEIDSSIPNPTRDDQIFGDPFPIADLPTRPFPPNSPIAPRAPSPPLPGNPVVTNPFGGGRGPASPRTPNPFGGGR